MYASVSVDILFIEEEEEEEEGEKSKCCKSAQWDDTIGKLYKRTSALVRTIFTIQLLPHTHTHPPESENWCVDFVYKNAFNSGYRIYFMLIFVCLSVQNLEKMWKVRMKWNNTKHQLDFNADAVVIIWNC